MTIIALGFFFFPSSYKSFSFFATGMLALHSQSEVSNIFLKVFFEQIFLNKNLTHNN
jgi:hypothetical protein